MKCPFGMAHWQVRTVSFRECNLSMGDFVSLSSSLIHGPIEDGQMECFHYRCPRSRVNHHFKTWWFFVWMKSSYEKNPGETRKPTYKKLFLDFDGGIVQLNNSKDSCWAYGCRPRTYRVSQIGKSYGRWVWREVAWEEAIAWRCCFLVFLASFKSKHVRISWIPYIACSAKDLYVPNDSSKYADTAWLQRKAVDCFFWNYACSTWRVKTLTLSKGYENGSPNSTQFRWIKLMFLTGVP